MHTMYNHRHVFSLPPWCMELLCLSLVDLSGYFGSGGHLFLETDYLDILWDEVTARGWPEEGVRLGRGGRKQCTQHITQS